ncbi:MAG: hypothetical protein COT17_00525 [Elusimicrobia bacterium CG08_land_8_20_14_0_20_51_18]|nr:MAG: hypothetical protein COT17_00525 [Elusimicrobia bacterium CG08_land_8_20_14_0_20_51_18]
MAKAEKILKTWLILPLIALFAVSCSKDYFREAEQLQKENQLLKAAQYYEAFAEKNPDDAVADIALYRAALIYSEKFEMCARSAEIFEKLVRDYPKSEFHDPAYTRVFVCPDYFPVDKVSKWYYGDSQSQGKNARENIFIKARDKDTARAEYSLYAGRRLVDRHERKYGFKDLVFVESRGKEKTPLIRYPVKKGIEWRSYKDPGVYYKISETGVKIKVKAGEFGNCVKIVEVNQAAGYGLVSYYAPAVGRVLTSIDSGGTENKIMELLKYE